MSVRNTAYEWIGKSIPRKEDPRLVSGRGIYIDDVAPSGLSHAAILPSPHAHARIKRIDTSAALKLPGVLLVMTGAEVRDVTGPLPCNGVPATTQYCLAVDRVRHVGEAVAAVVAEDRYIAEDAIRLIDVDYEPLPVMSDPEAAIHATGDGVLHPELGIGNVIFHRKFDFGDVAGDFAAAARIVRRKLRWPRCSAQPLETAGAIASYDPIEEAFTIYANTGGYTFYSRRYSAMLRVPGHKINIIPVLAGGSFGAKVALNKVVALAGALARATGRPVKYVEDRYDHLANSDTHGCDRIYDAELALGADGTLLSLRYKVIDDYGAYFQYGVAAHANTMAQLTGPYRMTSVSADITGVLTNKCQQGAYRGMGSEAHNFVIERMVDEAASELGTDPLELRERNLIRADMFPFRIPTGNIYDSGDYEAVLAKARAMFDYESWRLRQAEAAAIGRRIGIGVATCQERSTFSATEFWILDDKPSFPITSAPESVRLKIDAGGGIIVTLFSPFWGNSPETVAAQLVGEEFSVDPADIVVRYADSANGLMAKGPSGSRFTVMLAGAIQGAAGILKRKILRLASHLLAAGEVELELRNSRVQIIGHPERSLSLAEVALKAHFFRLSFPEDPELTSDLAAQYTYDHPIATLPNADRTDLGVFYPMVGHACHMVALEVNETTGQVRFLKYVAVHDCGTMVNPESVVGQIIGAIAQGVGTALYEQLYYDEDGQLLTSSFADYHMPTANEMPFIDVGHIETPSPFSAYGVKGAGEGGRLVAPAVIASAIEDAFRDLHLRVNQLPMTCARLRTLIRDKTDVRDATSPH